MSLSLLPGLLLGHRRCFHLAVAREMARLMQQSPKLPFVEPAFAGPEQVSSACPKLSAGLKLRLSSGQTGPCEPLAGPCSTGLHWLFEAQTPFSPFAGR